MEVNSGRVADDGTWDAAREKPITAADPGIYVQHWTKPQKVRGLAIKEIDGRLTKIDVYTGPATGPIDIAAADDWQEVAQYEQPRRYYYHPDANQNHDARYMDGYVDFGRDVGTRAVRLRIVEQWADAGDRSLYGVRNDRGGLELDPRRCRIYGLAVVGSAGGEAPLDKKIGERLEAFDSTSGQLKSEIELDQPGRLTYDPQGKLHAVSADNVVQVDRAAGKHRVVLEHLDVPGDIAFDAAGNLYVVEHGSYGYRIRVFDPQGKLLRTVGHAGPRKAGRWDPEVFGRIIDIDVDREGKLWVVEDEYWPKRVALFAADGSFEREFLGNTPYGGAGVLDPFDKRRMFVGPLEFELDWKTGHSRLKNLSWAGSTPAGELPIHVDDRIYVTTWLAGLSMPCGIVYRYVDDHLELAAAMGAAMNFEPLKSPELIARLGGPQLDRMKFIWSDLNGNGQVDADEVQLSPKPKDFRGLTRFERDLSAQAGQIRYEVKEFLPSGVPVYQESTFPPVFDSFGLTHLASGDFYRLGTDGKPEAGITAAGDIRWTYPNEGAGGHALYSAKPWFPAQIVAQGGYVGHEAPGGQLGEFCVFHTNAGGWNVMTGDGLLVASVFRDMRDPQAKPWSMSEHQRGMMLTDISLAQEHFQGYFCRSQADGKYYAVAGHNHASVVEILGLDQARRYSGTIEVSARDVERSQQWDEQQEKSNVYLRAGGRLLPPGKAAATGRPARGLAGPQRHDRRQHPPVPGLRRHAAVRRLAGGRHRAVSEQRRAMGPALQDRRLRRPAAGRRSHGACRSRGPGGRRPAAAAGLSGWQADRRRVSPGAGRRPGQAVAGGLASGRGGLRRRAPARRRADGAPAQRRGLCQRLHGRSGHSAGRAGPETGRRPAFEDGLGRAPHRARRP